MDLFTQIKMAVSVKEAAEYYGLEVNRGNMTRCPFHADRTPSMKLNEDYFYCFGCGAHGDVIDLVAKLFNLTSLQAAKSWRMTLGSTRTSPRPRQRCGSRNIRRPKRSGKKSYIVSGYTERRKRGRLPMVDEWSGFAALLANLIEKYAVVLNLDALPDLVIEGAVSEKVMLIRVFTKTILNP